MRMLTHFISKRQHRQREICGKCKGSGYIAFEKAQLLCTKCHGRGKWRRHA